MLAALIDLQNFEGASVPDLPTSWQTSGTGGNPWITVSGTSDSLPNHAFVMDDESVSDSMLISPVFLAAQQMSQVHFRNSYDTETGFDGGVLEISVNGGAFEDITVGGSFFIGGYNSTLNTGFGSALSGRAAWSGDSGGYLDTIANLPATALGQPVQLRWRMATDTSIQLPKAGWRIDTIRVSPTNGSGILVNDTESMVAARSNDVELGDLDGDGDLDAFVVNGKGGSSNRVWLNQGGTQGGTAGTFSDSGQSLGHFDSYAVSLGDLDGDGDLDAFVANDDSNRVWINEGGGQGGTPGTFSDSGQSLASDFVSYDKLDVSLGDLDGDGDLDAFVSRDGGNRVWVNEGGSQGGIAGSFSEGGQRSEDFASHAVSLGDVDSDGDLDAFVTNQHDPDQVWLNQGGLQGGRAGTFSDSGQRLENNFSRGVNLGDLDGDGDLDAVIAGSTRVWLNQGGAQGGTEGTFSDSGQSFGNSLDVSLGDLDGDGDLDAFVASAGKRVWINQGGLQGGAAAAFSDSGQSSGGFVSRGVSLGDLDGDGDLDAFVANRLSPNRVWINQGGLQGGKSGTFTNSNQSLGSFNGRGISLGDVDGDGDLDAVFVDSTGYTGVWINQGGVQSGTAGTFRGNGQALAGGGYDLSLGDVDGDGDLDAFVPGFFGSRILINEGGLQAGAPGTFSESSQSFGSLRSNNVNLGDLDSDGDLDAFVGTGGGRDSIWINQGGAQDGTEGTFSDSGQRLGMSLRDVSFGDLDGDGDLDAFGNGIWLNQGGLQGGTAGIFTDSGQNVGAWHASLGDLDGDGDLDAFAVSSSRSRVWLNQSGVQGGAAGTFSDNGQSLGSFGEWGVNLGDLDGDGDLDSYVTGTYGNRVWINQGGLQRGAGGIFSDSHQNVGYASVQVSLGDVDGDGDLDAFVVGATGNRVWLNQNLDFGDAPDTFGTTLANNGARHAPVGPILGSSRDGEANGQPSSDAAGDDVGDSGSADDEDGVTFGTIFVGQADATATVNVTVAAGKLDAWVDFNNDGEFDAVGERITSAQAVAIGDNTVVFDVPAIAVADQSLIARFRLSAEGGLGPRGAAADGEVEDHTVNLKTASVTAHRINGTANPNRSGVANIVFLFDGPATINDVTSLNIFNHTTGTPLDISAAVLRDNGTSAVTWDFSSVSFTDGYYTAELRQGAVTVATTHTVLFHVLAGDSSGNAQVDFADFVEFANHFNAVNVPVFGPGDMDGDGDVDFGDFGILANSFNRILTEPSIDFGDAPELGNAFPTTLANNGGRHIVGSGLSLGSTVDAEGDGQPSVNADGDGDDDDGVTFGTLQAGANVAITVIATVPGTAVLNAWIDFNRDGDWVDAGEHIFTDKAVNSGTNNLSVAIPPDATAGTTFARFRVASAAGYSYFGLAADGEVEDFLVTIVAASRPSIRRLTSGAVDLWEGMLIDERLDTHKQTHRPRRPIDEMGRVSLPPVATEVVDIAVRQVASTELTQRESIRRFSSLDDSVVDQILGDMYFRRKLA